MKRDMDLWLRELLATEKKPALPILSFPAVQLMGVSVRELISDSRLQAKGMQMVAGRVPAAASVSLMDLSVEAECFGASVRFSDDEVPTVTGALVSDEDAAKALPVPRVGAGRSGICVEALRLAAEQINDRPVFAGVIGPFSLAGRLMGVTEAMIYCYEEPEMVHILLEKACGFLMEYCAAFQAAGANGVVMAEPLAGLLSPELAAEFSAPYVKKIVEKVQNRNFAVVYHNCGGSTVQTVDSILSTGAAAYHFGNAISMAEMMTHIPSDVIVMGNVDPAAEFRNGTPESVRAATLGVMRGCCKYPNFIISSGCDIPPLSPWENIDAFFAAVDEFYASAGEEKV